MDFLQFPLPIINFINQLDSWSFKQQIEFKRQPNKHGYSWHSIYNGHFNLFFYLNEASSSSPHKVYNFGTGGNPGDSITFDSKISSHGLLINHPYQLDIDKIIQSRLEVSYKKWSIHVKEFEETTLFQIPPLRILESEFIQGIQLVDEDADLSSFNSSLQTSLLELIDNTLLALEKLNTYPDSSPQIGEAIVFAETVKKEIPKSTKNQVVRMLARFYSKVKPIAYQLSVEVLKYFSIEGVKAIIKL